MALICIFISTSAVKNIRTKYIERKLHLEEPVWGNKMIKPFEFEENRRFRRNYFNDPNHLPVMAYLPSLLNLFLIFTASSALRLYEKWQENEEIHNLKEKEKIQTELQFLKQQINPHFLFNSLNNIYSLALVKSELTTEAILKLSSILRYILYKSKEETVLLSEELEIVEDYIDLQRLRLTKQVDLSYKLDCENNSYRIEPFILLPIIENSFKYGVDNKNKSTIEINIFLEENKLTLIAKNSLFKRLQNVNSESSGIGIGNIVRRLELLYPGRYTFINEEQGDFYSVTLTIMLSE
jgi:LytS/YehU family sensor histidine kinase